MPRHQHADLMIAYANDTSLIIEYLMSNGRWLPLTMPSWSTDREYRIQPKPVVKVPMWQWVYRDGVQNARLSISFHANEDDFMSKYRGFKLLHRAEWTRIEVDA